MSSGYLVLIIYDLYCKCLERVFVKIMEVLVSDVQAWNPPGEAGALCPAEPPRWRRSPSSCRVLECQRKREWKREWGRSARTLTKGQATCGDPLLCGRTAGNRCRRSCQLRGEMSRGEGNRPPQSIHRHVPGEQVTVTDGMFLASKSEVSSACLG